MPAYQSGAPAGLGVIKSYSSADPLRRAERLLQGGSRRLGRRSTGYRFLSSTGAAGAAGPPVGGTSLAAPLWRRWSRSQTPGPPANAHPVRVPQPALYLIAGKGGYGPRMNDVTKGDNHLESIPNWWRYPATSGYDSRRGLGTPDAANASGGAWSTRLCSLPESGGVQYASPTRSSIAASEHNLDAVARRFPPSQSLCVRGSACRLQASECGSARPRPAGCG